MLSVKEIEVGKVYTITGEDRWECVSFRRDVVKRIPPNIAVGGPPIFGFVNLETNKRVEGMVDELPEFRVLMDIKEIRERKEQLESDILQIIRQFEDETTILIKRIIAQQGCVKIPSINKTGVYVERTIHVKIDTKMI